MKTETNRPLHEVIISKTVVVFVVVVIDLVVAVGVQGDLGLSGLSLLVALVSGTLFAHLLVASGGESAGNLLDIGTGEFLDELANEILGPEGVVRLFRLHGKQRNENFAQAVELILGGGLEQGHGGQIDGVGRVLRVGNNDGLGGTTVAVQVDVADQIGGVRQVGLLLGAAQAFTALSLSLIGVEVIGVLSFLPALLAVLFYPLGLGLLVGSGGSLPRGFGFGGLLGLLTLYFGVLGGVPGVKDLLFPKFVLAAVEWVCAFVSVLHMIEGNE